MTSKIARMHTAEHLLSAVMRQSYDAPRNLEFHLGEKKTKCDYAVSKPLKEEDIQEIERLVNREVARKHQVSSIKITRAEAADYDLWKVPGDIDEIQIVKIGAFDTQPCRGPHVANTAQVGRFQIASYEHRENNRVRIRFKLV